MKVRTSLAMLIIAVLAFSAFGNQSGLPVLPHARASGGPCSYVPPGVTSPVVYITNSTGNGPHEPAASMGSSHTFNVCVANMPSFKSWDIQVHVDETVLNPLSVSLSGSILPSPFVILECINGVLVAGSTCAASDGVGIVHYTVNTFGSASGGGLLFSISYNQLTGGGFSTVHIFTDVIVDSDGQLIQPVTQDGTFGSNLVIPELPFGSILALLLPVVALIVYTKARSLTIK